MIDPTADNWAYRTFKRFPDSKFGLQMVHFVTSLAKYTQPNRSLCVETVNIPRRNGHGRIRTLVVKPKKATNKLPVVVHLHGGGFALGLPEQDYDKVKRYNAAAPSIFVMPDYRLSLHEPFPAGLNDCYDTLLWVRDNAESIGGRPDQLFVMGESGGGGLTAAVSEMACDRNEVEIAAQFPIYAMLDDREENFSRCDPKDVTWSKEKNVLGWHLYLAGHQESGQPPPQYSVPARAQTFAGLPPSIGIVGDQDLFHDENIAYFDELKEAGVDTSFAVVKGAYHGAEILAPNSTAGKQIWDFLLKEFARTVDRYRSPQHQHPTTARLLNNSAVGCRH